MIPFYMFAVASAWVLGVTFIGVWFFSNGFDVGPRRLALVVFALLVWPVVAVGTFAAALITDRNIWAEWRKKPRRIGTISEDEL